MLNYNSNSPKKVIYNNNDVKVIKFNSTPAWGKPYPFTVTNANYVTSSHYRDSSPNMHAPAEFISGNVYYGDIISGNATCTGSLRVITGAWVNGENKITIPTKTVNFSTEVNDSVRDDDIWKVEYTTREASGFETLFSGSIKRNLKVSVDAMTTGRTSASTSWTIPNASTYTSRFPILVTIKYTIYTNNKNKVSSATATITIESGKNYGFANVADNSHPISAMTADASIDSNLKITLSCYTGRQNYTYADGELDVEITKIERIGNVALDAPANVDFSTYYYNGPDSNGKYIIENYCTPRFKNTNDIDCNFYIDFYDRNGTLYGSKNGKISARTTYDGPSFDLNSSGPFEGTCKIKIYFTTDIIGYATKSVTVEKKGER